MSFNNKKSNKFTLAEYDLLESDSISLESRLLYALVYRRFMNNTNGITLVANSDLLYCLNYAKQNRIKNKRISYSRENIRTFRGELIKIGLLTEVNTERLPGQSIHYLLAYADYELKSTGFNSTALLGTDSFLVISTDWEDKLQ
ncbi:hypothetical protein ACOI22_03850 [Glaciecola sp. 2405UD65-10]|uniref:hypothetical protein n=1 Tax=Glaciecola sp. 2405UD65-10 TaxID=3397244 RepID=UPI003B5A2521